MKGKALPLPAACAGLGAWPFIVPPWAADLSGTVIAVLHRYGEFTRDNRVEGRVSPPGFRLAPFRWAMPPWPSRRRALSILNLPCPYLAGGSGLGHTNGGQIEHSPAPPATHVPVRSVQVAEPYRPHCPPASKPAHLGGGQPKPAIGSRFPCVRPGVFRPGTVIRLPKAPGWQSGDEREGLAGWPGLVTLVLKGPLPGHVVAVTTLLASGSVKPGGLEFKVARPGHPSRWPGRSLFWRLLGVSVPR